MSERWRLPRAGVGTFWIRPSAYSPEHGYHGAALAEIARAAGPGNAGLIHRFPSNPHFTVPSWSDLPRRSTAGLQRRLRARGASRRDCAPPSESWRIGEMKSVVVAALIAMMPPGGGDQSMSMIQPAQHCGTGCFAYCAHFRRRGWHGEKVCVQWRCQCGPVRRRG